MTGQEFAAKYGVSFDWSAEGYHRDTDGWEHQRFTVTLVYTPRTDGATREFSTTWRQGLGIDHEPRVGDVLESLALDINSAAETFEDWAAECGYDEDSRRAERTYNACRDARRGIYDWCESAAMFEDFEQIGEAQ